MRVLEGDAQEVVLPKKKVKPWRVGVGGQR